MLSWDEAKNRENLRGHGVSFELASLVFDDPLAVSVPDTYPDEERWKTVGVVRDKMTLVVVHTITELMGPSGEEEMRIISARRATGYERRSYEESH
jgi:uncharacterized DUF497 family protein